MRHKICLLTRLWNILKRVLIKWLYQMVELKYLINQFNKNNLIKGNYPPDRLSYRTTGSRVFCYSTLTWSELNQSYQSESVHQMLTVYRSAAVVNQIFRLTAGCPWYIIRATDSRVPNFLVDISSFLLPPDWFGRPIRFRYDQIDRFDCKSQPIFLVDKSVKVCTDSA